MKLRKTYYTNADDKFSVFVIPLTRIRQCRIHRNYFSGTLRGTAIRRYYPEYYDTALKGKYSSEAEYR